MILKIFTVCLRVIKQVIKDNRLVTMIFLGPAIVIWLMFIVFQDHNTPVNLGVILDPKQKIQDLDFLKDDFILIPFNNTTEAKQALIHDKLLIAIDFTQDSQKIWILLEGTRPLQNQKAVYKLFAHFLEDSKDKFQEQINKKINNIKNKFPLQNLKDLKQSLIEEDNDKIKLLAEQFKQIDVNIRFPQINIEDLPTDPNVFFHTEYMFGGPQLTYFDSIAPTLVGFLIFFLVFLIGGIAFLRERTTHTLSRTLATPIKEWHFIMGYFFAFAFVILLQVIVLQSFCIFVLNIVNNGSFFYLFLINLFVSFTGLVLGFIFSTVSKTEFQLVQLIPIVVIPQFIFSGIFDTSSLPRFINVIGELLPLHYASTALVDISIRGRGFSYVWPSLVELTAFLIFLLICNAYFLKKIRQQEG